MPHEWCTQETLSCRICRFQTTQRTNKGKQKKEREREKVSSATSQRPPEDDKFYHGTFLTMRIVCFSATRTLRDSLWQAGDIPHNSGRHALGALRSYVNVFSQRAWPRFGEHRHPFRVNGELIGPSCVCSGVVLCCEREGKGSKGATWEGSISFAKRSFFSHHSYLPTHVMDIPSTPKGCFKPVRENKLAVA